MARRRMIYEGKAKILYEGPEPGTLIQYFKDDATAFNAQKKATIEGKGVLNNRRSEFLMPGLTNIVVPTHIIRRVNMRDAGTRVTCLESAMLVNPPRTAIPQTMVTSRTSTARSGEGTPQPIPCMPSAAATPMIT